MSYIYVYMYILGIHLYVYIYMQASKQASNLAPKVHWQNRKCLSYWTLPCRTYVSGCARPSH